MCRDLNNIKELAVSYEFDTAVFICRAQIPHYGHIENIKVGLTKAKKLIICLGSSHRAKTFANPFNWVERKDMLIEAMVEEFIEKPESQKGWSDYPIFKLTVAELSQRVIFVPVRDFKYSNHKWHRKLCKQLVESGVSHDKRTLLVGHQKDDTSFYLKMFPQWSTYFVQNVKQLNSTSFRDEFFLQGSIVSDGVPTRVKNYLEQFKESDFYFDIQKQETSDRNYRAERQSLRYPVIDVTSDAIVTKAGHILLIKRGKFPGKGLWALPGGHVGFDEEPLDAAVRELKEETIIDVPKPVIKNSLKTERPFTHPKRDSKGRVITFAYHFDLGDIGNLPDVAGRDDAVEAKWHPISDLYEIENLMFADHWDIIHEILSK